MLLKSAVNKPEFDWNKNGNRGKSQNPLKFVYICRFRFLEILPERKINKIYCRVTPFRYKMKINMTGYFSLGDRGWLRY